MRLCIYMPPTTSTLTCWNQFGGGCVDHLANCCMARENRRNRMPMYCNAMESWYGVISVDMVIDKSQTPLASLIYISHWHLPTVIPLISSIYSIVDLESCVQHHCYTFLCLIYIYPGMTINCWPHHRPANCPLSMCVSLASLSLNVQHLTIQSFTH